MKFFCFGDAHLRDSGSFIPFNRLEDNGLSYELNNILKGYSFISNLIEELKPDIVIDLGDTFHDNIYLTQTVLYAASIGYSHIKDVCNRVGCKFFILPGNHNTQSINTGIYSSKILSGYGEFVDSLFCENFNGINFSMIPFVSDYQLQEFLSLRKSDDVIFTHAEYSGTKYESGQISNSPISPKFHKRIISGHIHLSQDIGNVSYPGSLVQNRFTKFCNKKTVGGALVFDTDTNEIIRYKNTFSKHYILLDDYKTIKSYNPNNYVFKILGTEDKSIVEKFIPKEYEYMYVKSSVKNEVKVSYTNIEWGSPRVLLENHISQNNPDALDDFKEIFDGVE